MESEHACADGVSKLKCETSATGEKMWRLAGAGEVDNNNVSPTLCPAASIPWRQQAVCDGISVNTCYKTKLFGGAEDVAVCLHPVSSSEPMHQTWSGMRAMHGGASISHDQPVSRALVEAEYEPCVVHPFGDASNTAVIGYTAKGDRATCASMIRNAHRVCRKATDVPDECDTLVHAVHPDPGEPPSCTMRTNALPVAHKHDRREWWRWVRENSYTCKAEGWMCKDPELREHSAPSCKRDEECAAPVEQGWCDKKRDVCVLGGSVGKNCSKHEDCDHLASVRGECEGGRCTRGKTGIEAAYHIPKPCTHVSRDSLYTYCGEVAAPAGGTVYTGVCSAYEHEGKEYQGCRTLRNFREIEETRKSEHDWQAQNRPALNFHEQSPPWDRLDVCPAGNLAEIQGRHVCATTTVAVPLHTEGVSCDRLLPRAAVAAREKAPV